MAQQDAARSDGNQPSDDGRSQPTVRININPSHVPTPRAMGTIRYGPNGEKSIQTPVGLRSLNHPDDGQAGQKVAAQMRVIADESEDGDTQPLPVYGLGTGAQQDTVVATDEATAKREQLLKFKAALQDFTTAGASTSKDGEKVSNESEDMETQRLEDLLKILDIHQPHSARPRRRLASGSYQADASLSS
jgi:hypothetical protein